MRSENLSPKIFASSQSVVLAEKIAESYGMELGKVKKNLFSDVETYPTGAPEIQKFYQITKETISREIVFPNKVILSDIEGVNEAYIGTLEFNEFKKLITDNEGNILNSVFYDNVRAFQGDNPVNVKIEKTIKDKKFCLVDIGITAEHLCLQATEEELGTCMLGWFNEKRVKGILNIPQSKRVELIITMGYPESKRIRPKKRKPIDQIRSYNT